MSPRSGRASRAPQRSDQEQPLGAVLKELTAARPWASGIALGRLGRRWTEVVGERLAAETAPTRLTSGVLIVEASSAAWGAQLRFLAREVGERANATLGGEVVTEVRVVVANEGGNPRR